MLKSTPYQVDTSAVIEALIVGLIFILLIVSGLAVLYLPWHLLLVSGFIGIAIGLAVGMPAGFYYHLLLRRLLLKYPPLPERWWLHPTRFHHRLKRTEARAIFIFFYLGATGFLLIVAGAFIAMLGVVEFW